jgi:PHP family Zn ribbon phosphoesterase
VEKLADRPENIKRLHAKSYTNLIPLQEVLSEIMNVGVGSKKVQKEYLRILSILGNEFTVLSLVSIAEIEHAVHPELAEAIRRIRDGSVHIAPGYDGEYGKINIFERGERSFVPRQIGLFL